MNAAMLGLPIALRSLVDSRLDAIERALMLGNTPRAERCSILEDIETQILEMLSAEAAENEPTRADLLRVFTRLDPPEAFAGEPIESARPGGSPRGSAARAAHVTPETKPGYGATGILACVGGLVTLALGLPVCGFAMAFANSGMFALIAGALIALIGIPAPVLGILYALMIRQSQGRLRGLTCAAIGISALPISIVGLLGGFLAVASNSQLIIYAYFVFLCILAVVGAIHLTYRCLEFLLGAQQRPA